jgi:hypothetical protein
MRQTIVSQQRLVGESRDENSRGDPVGRWKGGRPRGNHAASSFRMHRKEACCLMLASVNLILRIYPEMTVSVLPSSRTASWIAHGNYRFLL